MEDNRISYRRVRRQTLLPFGNRVRKSMSHMIIKWLKNTMQTTGLRHHALPPALCNPPRRESICRETPPSSPPPLTRQIGLLSERRQLHLQSTDPARKKCVPVTRRNTCHHRARHRSHMPCRHTPRYNAILQPTYLLLSALNSSHCLASLRAISVRRSTSFFAASRSFCVFCLGWDGMGWDAWDGIGVHWGALG